jgi:thiol:disulfide interchange protein DsbD
LFLEGNKISVTSAADAWFFPDKWGAIDAGAQQTPTITASKLALALKRGQTFDPNEALTGVLVIEDANGKESFYTISADPSAPSRTQHSASDILALPSLLILAFLGGLILNLMPCVFPVLAIKALSIAKLCGQERRAVRAQAASYTLGVLIAFAALGSLLLVFRAAKRGGVGLSVSITLLRQRHGLALLACGLEPIGRFRG